MKPLSVLALFAGLGLVQMVRADPTTQAIATANFAVMNTSNGTTFATANASANDGQGSSSANASVGTLGGSATVTGCGADPLFQQVCNSASSYSAFTDTLSVVGPNPGAPVSLEMDWSVDGTVDGTGAYGLQARFIAGNEVVEIDSGGTGDVETYSDVSIGGSKSLIFNTSEGANFGIAAFMNLGVANRDFWGGTDFCDVSLTWHIVEDASHTAAITAKVLTPGADVEVLGASGHNYLAPAASEVPEPASICLFGSGLLSLCLLRRRK